MSYGAHYYHIPLDPHYWSTQLTCITTARLKVSIDLSEKKHSKTFSVNVLYRNISSFLSMIQILDFWKALLNSAAMLIQENNQNLFKYFTALPSRKQETHQGMR